MAYSNLILDLLRESLVHYYWEMKLASLICLTRNTRKNVGTLIIDINSPSRAKYYTININSINEDIIMHFSW